MSPSSVAVLSDGHLGDRDSWLETEVVQHALVSYLARHPSVTSLVLLGDTLDLNFGTLKTAIDGRYLDRSSRRPGFRALLGAICSETRIGSIVYVPGNHDYAIWDWEARQRHVLAALARGEELPHRPMCRGCLEDSFLAGLVPAGRQVRFSVTFPDHVRGVGDHWIVLTHGHWLEKVQTGGVVLADVASADCTQAFLEHLAVASAQYQAFASALAIRRRTRVGLHKVYKAITSAWDCVCICYEAMRRMRGKAPSAAALRVIDVYLRYVVRDALASGLGPRPSTPRLRPSSSATPMCPASGRLQVPPRGETASMLILSPAEYGVAADLIRFIPSGDETSQPLDS